MRNLDIRIINVDEFHTKWLTVQLLLDDEIIAEDYVEREGVFIEKENGYGCIACGLSYDNVEDAEDCC